MVRNDGYLCISHVVQLALANWFREGSACAELTEHLRVSVPIFDSSMAGETALETGGSLVKVI